MGLGIYIEPQSSSEEKNLNRSCQDHGENRGTSFQKLGCHQGGKATPTDVDQNLKSRQWAMEKRSQKKYQPPRRYH